MASWKMHGFLEKIHGLGKTFMTSEEYVWLLKNMHDFCKNVEFSKKMHSEGTGDSISNYKKALTTSFQNSKL